MHFINTLKNVYEVLFNFLANKDIFLIKTVKSLLQTAYELTLNAFPFYKMEDTMRDLLSHKKNHFHCKQTSLQNYYFDFWIALNEKRCQQ